MRVKIWLIMLASFLVAEEVIFQLLIRSGHNDPLTNAILVVTIPTVCACIWAYFLKEK